MTDEKQIKKMAQDIACNCVDLVETSCDGKPCYVCIAEKLAKQNYRKIPENAVVVMPDKLDEYQIIKAQARKETAREVIAKIIWYAVKHIKGKNKDECFIEISFEKIDEIAKQYGIETEE